MNIFSGVRGTMLAALCCGAMAVPVQAGDPAPAPVPGPAGTPQVAVRALGGGLTLARASVELPWPPERVFDLVADFDHLGDFVSAIDSSTVVRRDSTGIVVRQVGTTTLVFRKTVRMTLRFTAERPAALRFEILDGDFRVYYGAWTFLPGGAGTQLAYDVTFAAAAKLPGSLVRHVVHRDLQRMLAEVAAEIGRRDSRAAAPGR